MTSSTCADPRIGEQLLDLAQFARRRALPRPIQLSSEQAWHLDGCASCRASLERARRLVAAHQSLEPSDAEVAAARVRFAQRRLRLRPGAAGRRVLSRAVTVALLLAMVAAAAAQIAIRRPWQRPGSQDVSKDGARPHRALRRSGPAQPPIELAPSVASRAVAAEPEPGGASSSAALAPTAHGANDRRARAPSRAPVAVRADAPALEAPMPVESAAGLPARAAGSWEAVAAALRAGDDAAAERALNLLVGLDDARTRDAARLARAQLWLAHGRAAPARGELQDLAATGATTTIRARAREALRAHP